MPYHRHKHLTESNKNTVEITAVKIFAVLIVVMTVFVIPAQLIDLYKVRSAQAAQQAATQQVAGISTTGQVAGTSTSAVPSQDAVYSITHNQQSLFLLGLSMLTLSVAVSVYLLGNISTRKRSRRNDNFETILLDSDL